MYFSPSYIYPPRRPRVAWPPGFVMSRADLPEFSRGDWVTLAGRNAARWLQHPITVCLGRGSL